MSKSPAKRKRLDPQATLQPAKLAMQLFVRGGHTVCSEAEKELWLETFPLAVCVVSWQALLNEDGRTLIISSTGYLTADNICCVERASTSSRSFIF